MKAGLLALIALLLLVLVSAAALTMHGIRYLPVEATPPAAVSAPAPPAAPPPAPERVRNPQALLLLDVSGSMAAVSDHDHMQTEAVLHFYRTFQALAPEVLEPGENTSVAIVTFGSGAELLTWDGEPFLTVSEQNEKVFEKEVLDHLGRRGTPDPRQDQWTESSTALRRARDLLTRGGEQAGPPAVILLTDGKPEVEGLDLASLQQEARAELAHLLAVERPFGDHRAPPVWAPVLLLGGKKAAETEAIGRETFWDEPTRRTSRAAWPDADVITCRQPVRWCRASWMCWRAGWAWSSSRRVPGRRSSRSPCTPRRSRSRSRPRRPRARWCWRGPGAAIPCRAAVVSGAG